MSESQNYSAGVGDRINEIMVDWFGLVSISFNAHHGEMFTVSEYGIAAARVALLLEVGMRYGVEALVEYNPLIGDVQNLQLWESVRESDFSSPEDGYTLLCVPGKPGRHD